MLETALQLPGVEPLAKWISEATYTWYYFGIACYIFFWIVIIPPIFGYEWRLKPFGLRKYRMKWNSRTVSAVGLASALMIVSLVAGNMVVIIPGTMTLFVFWAAFLGLSPCIFGLAGVWAGIIHEYIGETLIGWLWIGSIISMPAANGGPMWIAYKLFARDPSLKTWKSWVYWFLAFSTYAIFGSLLWCTVVVLFGSVPINIFPLRLAYDFIWFYGFIWIQPPLMIIFKALNDKYRLWRYDDVYYPEEKKT